MKFHEGEFLQLI
jgi:hypothetical protein